MVSKEAPLLSIHAKLVRDAHVPLNICNTMSEMVEGLAVITCEVAVASNLYQTSSSAVPEQPTCDCDAPIEVPIVLVEQVAVVFTVNKVACAQSLFEGIAKDAEVKEILSIAAGGSVPKLPSFFHSKTSLKLVPA